MTHVQSARRAALRKESRCLGTRYTSSKASSKATSKASSKAKDSSSEASKLRTHVQCVHERRTSFAHRALILVVKPVVKLVVKLRTHLQCSRRPSLRKESCFFDALGSIVSFLFN
jgi:hypothetical protein